MMKGVPFEVNNGWCNPSMVLATFGDNLVHVPEYLLFGPLQCKPVCVLSDMCRHGEEAHTSPDVYHAWIDQYSIFFGLDKLLTKESLRYMFTTQPHRFLPSMRHMSRAFE